MTSRPPAIPRIDPPGWTSHPRLRATIGFLSGTRTRGSRRFVAAGLAGLAVLALSAGLKGTDQASGTVVIAARDLAAGTVLSPDDMVESSWFGTSTTGLLTQTSQALGKRTAVPVIKGAPVATNTIVGPALLDDASLVLAPVSLFDAGATELVAAGDHVDLLAAPTGATAAGPAVVVAADARVVATPARGIDQGSAGFGTESAGRSSIVLLAVDRPTAARIAAAAAVARLSIAVRSPGSIG